MVHLLENVNPVLVFETRSGDLAVTKQSKGYVMDFPLNPPTQEVQCVSMRSDQYIRKLVTYFLKVKDVNL